MADYTLRAVSRTPSMMQKIQPLARRYAQTRNDLWHPLAPNSGLPRPTSLIIGPPSFSYYSPISIIDQELPTPMQHTGEYCTRSVQIAQRSRLLQQEGFVNPLYREASSRDIEVQRIPPRIETPPPPSTLEAQSDGDLQTGRAFWQGFVGSSSISGTYNETCNRLYQITKEAVLEGIKKLQPVNTLLSQHPIPLGNRNAIKWSNQNAAPPSDIIRSAPQDMSRSDTEASMDLVVAIPRRLQCDVSFPTPPQARSDSVIDIPEIPLEEVTEPAPCPPQNTIHIQTAEVNGVLQQIVTETTGPDPPEIMVVSRDELNQVKPELTAENRPDTPIELSVAQSDDPTTENLNELPASELAIKDVEVESQTDPVSSPPLPLADLDAQPMEQPRCSSPDSGFPKTISIPRQFTHRGVSSCTDEVLQRLQLRGQKKKTTQASVDAPAHAEATGVAGTGITLSDADWARLIEEPTDGVVLASLFTTCPANIPQVSASSPLGNYIEVNTAVAEELGCHPNSLLTMGLVEDEENRANQPADEQCAKLEKILNWQMNTDEGSSEKLPRIYAVTKVTDNIYEVRSAAEMGEADILLPPRSLTRVEGLQECSEDCDEIAIPPVIWNNSQPLLYVIEVRENADGEAECKILTRTEVERFSNVRPRFTHGVPAHRWFAVDQLVKITTDSSTLTF